MASCGVRTERDPSFYLTAPSFSGSNNCQICLELEEIRQGSNFTVLFSFYYGWTIWFGQARCVLTGKFIIEDDI